MKLVIEFKDGRSGYFGFEIIDDNFSKIFVYAGSISYFLRSINSLDFRQNTNIAYYILQLLAANLKICFGVDKLDLSTDFEKSMKDDSVFVKPNFHLPSNDELRKMLVSSGL